MTDYAFGGRLATSRHQTSDDRLIPGISGLHVDPSHPLTVHHQFINAPTSSILVSSTTSVPIESNSVSGHIASERETIDGCEQGAICWRQTSTTASWSSTNVAVPKMAREGEPKVCETIVDFTKRRSVADPDSVTSHVENNEILRREQSIAANSVRLPFNDVLKMVPPVSRSATRLLDADWVEKHEASVTGSVRRGGGGASELRNGWAAKSPKSYWLRRHSDSLLVADVVQPCCGNSQPCRQGHQRSPAYGSSGENAIDLKASRNNIGGVHEVSMITRSVSDDNRPLEAFVDSRQRPVSTSVIDTQPPSSSPFECDDVFDDDIEDQPSPKKIAYGACYVTTSSPVNVLISSPEGPRRIQTSTADEIACRFEQLHPGERRLSRSQRSSGSIVDDQCGTELPKIVEERDEDYIVHGGLSSFRLKDGRSDGTHSLMIHDTIPMQRDTCIATVARSPSQLSSASSSSSSLSGTKVELHIDDAELANIRRQLVRVDSPVRGDQLVSSSAMRHPRPTPVIASGFKSGRHHHQMQSPSAMDSNSSLSASATAGVNPSASSVKLHRCSVCRRSFARSDMLERHARLHTGVRPYSCRLCSQVFSRSDHLTTHLRTHTGEKPYQCPRCSYSASRRDMVTRHLRVHVHDSHVDADIQTGNGDNNLSSSTALLSPLTIGGSLNSKRRPMRAKKRERYQHREESACAAAAAAAVSETGAQFGSSSSWPLHSPNVVDSFGAAAAAAAVAPSTKPRRPPWMSPIESDSGIKAVVDSWTRSMVNCLSSPTPMRSSASMAAGAYRHGDEAAVSARGLSLILARGSTGSTDSYSSPGCCSMTGSGDVFEFGGLAEGSPDVFRSPAAAARHTMKFLWPLVPQSLQSDTSPASAPSYDSPTI